MTTTLLRAGAGFCGLLATTALTMPAYAQSGLTLPVRQVPDENGVDVISGHVTTPFQSVSIGQPGSGGLTYETGYAAGVNHDTLNAQVIEFTGGARVELDGDVRIFNKDVSGNYTPADGDGETLVYDSSIDGYILTLRDGTVVRFLKSLAGITIARASTITRPNGEIITYSWLKKAPSGGVPVSRVQSITNNFGYQLKPTYVSDTYVNLFSTNWFVVNRVQAINNAVDYCDPTANSCTGLTQSWPTVTLASSTSGSTVTRTATDSLNQTTTIVANGTGITSRNSPANPAADFTLTYDGNGRVATLTRGSGSWGYGYADSGTTRTTTVTEPLGGTRIYVSNTSLLQVTSVTDELGHTTNYQYDSNARLTRVTRPEGNYTQLTYDSRGNVIETRQVAKPSSGLSDIVVSATYPSACTNPVTCNRPTSTTDERGNVTDFTYDSIHGGALTATAPAPTTGATRPQVRLTYAQRSAWYKNSAGSIVQAASAIYLPTAVSTCQTGSSPSCVGTADESRTSVDYGAGSSSAASNLLPVSISSGAGNGSLTANVANAYDVVGNLTSIDGPLEGSDDTIGYRYDADRRRMMTVSPDPDGAGPLLRRAVQTLYDGNGNPIQVQAGTTATLTGAFTPPSSGERVRIDYDSFGRRTSEALLTGTLISPTINLLTQHSFDSKGRPDCTAVRMNPAEFGSPPSSACTSGMQGSYGPDRIAHNVYYADNRIYQVQTGYGTSDQANEVTTQYTDNGRVFYMLDGNSNITVYQQDGFDRTLATYYAHPTSGYANWSDYDGFAYDANSNVISRHLRDGSSIGYSFDALNRLTDKDLPGSEPDVSYSYDLLDRVTGASFAGHTLSFTFDALSRNLSQAGPLGTISYTYDLAGQRTSMTYPGSPALVVGYVYDAAGEMTEIRENPTGTNALLAAYAYDNLGRRETLTRADGTSTTYSYDAASRLGELVDNLGGTGYDQTVTFGYSPASQITSTDRSNDVYAWGGHYAINRNYAANRLNQYTASGSVTPTYDLRGNLTSAGGTPFYSYDSENRLTSSWGQASLSYDPLGRLFQTSGASTTRFGYDGQNMIAEFNTSNALVRRYVFGPGFNVPLVWYEGAGLSTRRFFHADERGSIVAITDGSGAVINVNTYDEHGIPGASNSGRFQYTGQAWLPEIGVYYYRARIYSPTLGRFLQTDPIGFGGGMNLYAYVRADPVNLIDPSGLVDEGPQPPIVVTGSRCPEGWSCYYPDHNQGFATLGRTDPTTGEEEISVFAHRRFGILERIVRAIDGLFNQNCEDALHEDGAILTRQASFNVTVVRGITGTIGTFANVRTHTTGFFVTSGMGSGGAEIELSGGVSYYRDLASLNGYNENIDITIEPVTVTRHYNNNGELVGGSIGPGAGLGYAVSRTQTVLLGCTPNSLGLLP
jgi:RHS repeat-associated protein